MKTLLLLGGITPDVTTLYYGTTNTVTRTGLAAVVAVAPTKPIVDGVVVGAILAHKVAKQLEDALKPTRVRLLNVADFLARHVKSVMPYVKMLGLIGPKVTMLGAEDPDFFIGQLQASGNELGILVPESEASLNEVNRGKMEEVAKGAANVTAATKAMFVHETKALVDRGAQAIILGNTDLGFVISREDVEAGVPLLDAATIHAEGVTNWAIDR